MGDIYDLAYKSLDEILEDTSAPASADFILRFDDSAGEFKKVGADDLAAQLNVNATAGEINRVADVSARNVNTTSDLTLTQASHEGRTVVVDKADGAAITLPAASVGDKYRVVIGTTVTSNSTTIKVANASDSFVGGLNGVDNDAEGATGYQWKADSGDDTITFNGSATGGFAGDFVNIECIKANTFLVSGEIKQSGGAEATPFSATVS